MMEANKKTVDILISFLLNPGGVIGCLIGVGLSFVLHWQFPEKDLIALQAIIIVIFTLAGLVIENPFPWERKKK